MSTKKTIVIIRKKEKKNFKLIGNEQAKKEEKERRKSGSVSGKQVRVSTGIDADLRRQIIKVSMTAVGGQDLNKCRLRSRPKVRLEDEGSNFVNLRGGVARRGRGRAKGEGGTATRPHPGERIFPPLVPCLMCKSFAAGAWGRTGRGLLTRKK